MPRLLTEEEMDKYLSLRDKDKSGKKAKTYLDSLDLKSKI